MSNRIKRKEKSYLEKTYTITAREPSMYDYHSYIRGMIHTSERSIGALRCMITLMYEPTPPPMFDGCIHTLELRCSNMHSDEYVRLYAPKKLMTWTISHSCRLLTLIITATRVTN